MAKRQRRVVPFNELMPRSLIHSMTEGTDLACALIGGAYIENAAGSLLEKIMVDAPEVNGPNGVLNDHNGILSAASARIDMCFCLGMIDQITRRNAKGIAKIRNTFAHSHRPIDFADAEVLQECRNLHAQLSDPDDVRVFAGLFGGLSIPTRPIKPLDLAVAKQILSKPRHRFVFAACWTLLVLYHAMRLGKDHGSIRKGNERIHDELMAGKTGPTPLPSADSFLILEKEGGKLLFDTIVLLDT
jgi:hypothetical protein